MRPLPGVARPATAVSTSSPEAVVAAPTGSVSVDSTEQASAAGSAPTSVEASEATSGTGPDASDKKPPRAAVPKATPAAQIDPSPWIGRPLNRAPWPTCKIAITLDDGPSTNTAEVLAIFRRHRLKATFFYVGDRCQRYEKLVKQAFGEGFEIGDHTLDHQEIFRESARFDLREIDLGAAELERETGIRPVFMRPPAGHWDATTLRSISGAAWSWRCGACTGRTRARGRTPSVIARRAIANARGGDIILLHETNPETVKALPAIIEGMRAQRPRARDALGAADALRPCRRRRV